MSRHDVVIIKDTHRGLLYEDGVFRDVLPAGRYEVPRQPSRLAAFFGARSARAEIVLVDVRWRDRVVAIQDFLTADGSTISATFAVKYRVVDPRAATHEVKNFDERAYADAQVAARRTLRGMSLEEILGGRDEIGEELLRQLGESAVAYGLEVSDLDFKDLTIPADLREMMNRAVLARRLRQAQPIPADEPDGDFDDSPADEEDPDLINARSSFGAGRTVSTPPESFFIRRPDDQGPAASAREVTGFDPALRRYRP